MALATSYLLSTKRVNDIFEAIRSAQAPDQFTLRFLEELGFPSSADRPMVKVLKDLGFLSESGSPTTRYYEYLDPSRSGAVMAEALRDAYGDLFKVNANAQEMSPAEVKAKLKTLTKGRHTDKVVGQIATTFKKLVELADFDSVVEELHGALPEEPPDTLAAAERIEDTDSPTTTDKPSLGGLVYSINIHLPESRDPAVYDALFRSLKIHLFG